MPDGVITILLEKLSRHAFVDYSALRRKDLAERVRDTRKKQERSRKARSRSFPLTSEELSGSKTENTPERETGLHPEFLGLTSGPTLEADPGIIPADTTIKHPETIPNTKDQLQGASSDAAPVKLPDMNPGTSMKTAQASASRTFRDVIPVIGSGMVHHSDGDTLAPAASHNYILSQQAEYDLIRFREWLESHRYPPNTVRTYTTMIEAFLKFVSPKEACHREEHSEDPHTF